MQPGARRQGSARPMLRYTFGMATFTGTVRKNDLEGGFLELVTEAGDTYRLNGASPKPGQRVRVTGSVESGGFGIHMSGPAIEVESIEDL